VSGKRPAQEAGTLDYTVERLRGAGFFEGAAIVLSLIFLFCTIYLAQFACLFLLLILLGSRVYSEYLIRNIRFRRREQEIRAFRHEWVRVELLVENQGRLPALMLALSDFPGRLPVFRDNKLLRTLPGRSRSVMMWQAYCSERGIYSLGPAAIRGSDPLGLFPFRLVTRSGLTLYVYPAPGAVFLRNPGGIPLGTLISPNPLYEDVTRCRSLRDYQAGDEPRRINWKATARSGALTVNEYESTVSYPLMIFLNADPCAYSLGKRELYFERAIEAAAALCLMVSRERQEMGIIIYTGPGKALPVISPSAFTLIPILERLAGLERSGPEEGEKDRGRAPPASTDSGALSGGAAVMLDRGKYMSYGTRLVYAGPELTNEEYVVLSGLKRYHLSLEYLVIDERTVPALAPGNSRRYQMKEAGYEII
jgi:uncharacterized protein (DUF58 family)